MKQFKTVTLMVIAMSPAFLAGYARSAVEPARESCSNIAWNPQFLEVYPTAAAACRSVTVKDGLKYAKFNGKVSKVDHQFVQVDVSNVAGTPINTIAFEVGVGGRITLNDKVEKVKDLKVGDDVIFWVREGAFGVSPTLKDAPMPIIKPTAMPVT